MKKETEGDEFLLEFDRLQKEIPREIAEMFAHRTVFLRTTLENAGYVHGEIRSDDAAGICNQILKSGYGVSLYAERLIEHFALMSVDGTKNANVTVRFGADPSWLMDAATVGTPSAIENVVGYDVLTPVASIGRSLVFVAPDGKAFLMGPPFGSVVEANTFFDMFEFLLTGNEVDGLTKADVPKEDWPPCFR